MPEIIQAPCQTCINLVMCVHKDEIVCPILKEFYLNDSLPYTGRRYRSLYKQKLSAIQIALGKLILDYGYDEDGFWMNLFETDIHRGKTLHW